MSLLQLLQEASSLPVADLKKAVQKDKRAAPVLKPGIKLEDIPDKDAFLASVKFHIFNNDKVRDFVKQRHNIKDVDKAEFDNLRKLRASELDEVKFSWLVDFVRAIFKEHSAVERGSLSRELKSELNDWFNNSGRYYNLRPWAIKELDSVPGLKPTKRTLVYRGLLFTESDLSERNSYDGTLEVGNGLTFLRSIRKGERTVDLVWDRPSSWTKGLEVAKRFAQYGPASSNFSATLQWLDRSMKKKHIDGAIGFVISTFVEPENVLLDTDRFNAAFHMQHGSEGEVILKPGTYVCRIVKKFTVDEGEVAVDAEAKTVDTSYLDEAMAKLKELDAELSMPEGLEDIGNGWGYGDVEHLTKDLSFFKRLILNSTTTQAHHAHDKFTDFFKTTLQGIDQKLLSAETHATNATMGRKVKHLRHLIERLSSKVGHPKFKKDPKEIGIKKGPRHELSAEEYRTTLNAPDLMSVEKPLLTTGRVSDRQGSRVLLALAKAAGVSLPSSAQPHMFGAPKQAKMVDDIIDGLFKKLDIEKHEDRAENVKLLLTLLKKAYRNYKMLNDVADLKRSIKEMTNADAA